MNEIRQATKTFEALVTRAAALGAIHGDDVVRKFGRIEVKVPGSGDHPETTVRLDHMPDGSVRLRSDLYDPETGSFEADLFFSMCERLSDRLRPFVDEADKGVAPSDRGVPGRTTHTLMKQRAHQQVGEALKSVLGLVVRPSLPVTAMWHEGTHTVMAKSFGDGDETYMAVVSARGNRPTSIRIVALDDTSDAVERLAERRIPTGGVAMSFSPDEVKGDPIAAHSISSRMLKACHATALAIATDAVAPPLDLPKRRPTASAFKP